MLEMLEDIEGVMRVGVCKRDCDGDCVLVKVASRDGENVAEGNPDNVNRERDTSSVFVIDDEAARVGECRDLDRVTTDVSVRRRCVTVSASRESDTVTVALIVCVRSNVGSPVMVSVFVAVADIGTERLHTLRLKVADVEKENECGVVFAPLPIDRLNEPVDDFVADCCVDGLITDIVGSREVVLLSDVSSV